jgi:hypothetical protein
MIKLLPLLSLLVPFALGACQTEDRPLIRFYESRATSPYLKVAPAQIHRVASSQLIATTQALQSRGYLFLGACEIVSHIPATDYELQKLARQVGSDYILSSVEMTSPRRSICRRPISPAAAMARPTGRSMAPMVRTPTVRVLSHPTPTRRTLSR